MLRVSFVSREVFTLQGVLLQLNEAVKNDSNHDVVVFKMYILYNLLEWSKMLLFWHLAKEKKSVCDLMCCQVCQHEIRLARVCSIINVSSAPYLTPVTWPSGCTSHKNSKSISVKEQSMCLHRQPVQLLLVQLDQFFYWGPQYMRSSYAAGLCAREHVEFPAPVLGNMLLYNWCTLIS